MPNLDSLKHIQDSLEHLVLIKESLKSYDWKADLNFYLAIAGGVGTLLGIYAFWLQWRSKKQQDYVFKLAQTVMEKDDAKSELLKSKEELSSVEKRLTDLQAQIKRDIPVEARKAVLLDRLNESVENLTKYHEDILATKKKLSQLGTTTNISDNLLRSIQTEIEPRYILREKVSNFKTLLTVASSLSGIAFATIPYPIGEFIGIIFLISGLPLLLLILKYSLKIRGFEKGKVNSLVKIGISGTFSLICLPVGSLLLFLLFSGSNHSSDISLMVAAIISFVSGIISLAIFLNAIKVYRSK